ncbi:MAG: hypothetical protein L0227_19350 [Chloroflexi bacterium]|nr:hypothetical protein [Chloroflexota bacterium]
MICRRAIPIGADRLATIVASPTTVAAIPTAVAAIPTTVAARVTTVVRIRHHR